MGILISFHLVGMVLWMSGLLVVSSQLRRAVKNGVTPEVVRVVIAPLAKVFMHSGFFLSLVTGILQLTIGGPANYFKAGWFHAKMTLLIILIVMTVLLSKKLKAYISNNIPTEKSLLVIHIISATTMLMIFICATLKF